jgi:hypothetical protein
VEDIKIALHVFLVVLIAGTLWRLATYHLMDSPNAHLQHLGRAMSIQY